MEIGPIILVREAANHAPIFPNEFPVDFQTHTNVWFVRSHIH